MVKRLSLYDCVSPFIALTDKFRCSNMFVLFGCIFYFVLRKLLTPFQMCNGSKINVNFNFFV